MRLLHVTHRFLPRYLAGTEVYAGALARAQHERGHAVRVFTGDPALAAPEMYEWEGLRVQATPWGIGRAGPVGTFLAGLANPAVDGRFAAALDDFRPDLVHIHHLLGLSPRLPALARRRGARVVITLHDFWFQCSNTWLYRYSRMVCPGPGWGYHCGGCALERLGRRPQPLLMTLTAPLFLVRTARLRRALLAAHRLIAPSRAVAEAYLAHGIPAGRLTVLPHGLATGGGADEAPADPHPPRFLYLGSLIRPKGAHVAVEAFHGVDVPGAELRLYGDLEADPAYVAELRALARRPPVPSSPRAERAGGGASGERGGVVFAGRLPREQVAGALRWADVLLLPSLWREAHSIVVDEALAAGRPVLVSDHTAAAERVIAGQNGLTAPPGDVAAWRAALVRLASEPGLLARLRHGVRAPKSLAEHVAEMETLYAGL